MSVHYEWMAATDTRTGVVTTGCELGMDVVDAPLALLIESDEVTVIEGTRDELEALLTRALKQIRTTART